MIVPFFEKAVSADNLRIAWVQLKSNPGFVSALDFSEFLNKINIKWFEKTSQLLIKGKFKYSN